MSGKLKLEGMVFFAHHGHFHEEREKGNKFVVDLVLDADFSKAAESDKLTDALNYEEIYVVVKQQMEKRSLLLEHVAHRITRTLKKQFPSIKQVSVTLSKINPPIRGMVDRVSVTLDG